MSEPTGEAAVTPPDPAPKVSAYVERRETSPRYVFGGGVWIVLADQAQTGGNIANLESIYQRGGGFPRRVHERETEMAFVISGRLRVRLGDEPETTAEPGAMIFVPPGIARKFTADLDETRVYHGFVPAGFEQLLVERGLKTELMTVPIAEAPFDAAAAVKFGVQVIPG